jgi:hypothetical protein
MESIAEAKVDLLEASIARTYMDELKALLSKGSIVEQKSFLRSFVKRVEENLPPVVITGTLPLKTQKVEPPEEKFYLLLMLAPRAGFEPATKWLTATRSAD